MQTQVITSDFLTIDEAATYLRCSRVFIWKRRKEGKIKSVNAGSKVLISKASIDAYLNLNQKEVSCD